MENVLDRNIGVERYFIVAFRDRPASRCRGRQAGEERFKSYPIGCFHIDIAEVRTEQGICQAWASQPERFKRDPLQKMPGLNS